MTPYAFCQICKYAGNSTAMWPCRCCSRINRMENHFTPADEDADDLSTHGDEIRALGDIGLAKFIIDRLHITCGNCPAEAACMLKSGQETILPSSEACKHLFAFWLAQKGSGNGGGAA